MRSSWLWSPATLKMVEVQAQALVRDPPLRGDDQFDFHGQPRAVTFPTSNNHKPLDANAGKTTRRMEQTQASRPSISTADWDTDYVLGYSSNFKAIKRVKATSSASIVEQEIKNCEATGIPLIVEDWHKHKKWPKDMFTLDFFQKNSLPAISVRNIHDWKDSKMPLQEFIQASREAPPLIAQDEKRRLYGKDAECPAEWSRWIKEANVIPEMLHWNGSNDYFRYRPKNARVETLMCYLGIGDTFTPAHKDLCASSGHNLMCYTENGGSAYWFMTQSSDAAAAADFFQSLKQELDHETHVVTLKELSRAPFPVYVTEQRLGDLVLVPPRSCHQVVNNGGISLKTSWSRMTLKGLLTAYYHELPIYQRVCRLETYRVKSTIFCALRNQTKELEQFKPSNNLPKASKRPRRSLDVGNINLNPQTITDLKASAIIESVKTLLGILRDIMAQEHGDDKIKCVEETVRELDGEQAMENRTVCDFCGGDIFQAFFECGKACKGVEESPEYPAGPYTICPACYADGRSCRCITMVPRQVFPRSELLRVVNHATQVLKEFHPDWKEAELNSDYSVFRAACKLMTTRNKFVCHYDKGLAWALNCKACHHSRCFKHLLDKGKMHAVEAVSIWAEDSSRGHKTYHKYHREAEEQYDEYNDAIVVSQKTGSQGPIDMLRVYNALKYRTCRPWCHSSSVEGFYDVYVQDCSEEQFDDIKSDASELSENSTHMSTLSPCPSDVSLPWNGVMGGDQDSPPRANETASSRARSFRTQGDLLLSGEEEAAAPPLPTPNSRMVMAYVEVPKAPYSLEFRTRKRPYNDTTTEDVSSKVGPPKQKKQKALVLEQPDTPGTDPQTPVEIAPSRSNKAKAVVKQGNKDNAHAQPHTPSDSAPLTTLSSSSARQTHRFKSGLVVTLLNSPAPSPIPQPLFKTPPPPSSHISPAFRPAGKQKIQKGAIETDIGLSLADVMNNAFQSNSRGPESTTMPRGTATRPLSGKVAFQQPVPSSSSSSSSSLGQPQQDHRSERKSPDAFRQDELAQLAALDPEVLVDRITEQVLSKIASRGHTQDGIPSIDRAPATPSQPARLVSQEPIIQRKPTPTPPRHPRNWPGPSHRLPPSTTSQQPQRLNQSSPSQRSPHSPYQSGHRHLPIPSGSRQQHTSARGTYNGSRFYRNDTRSYTRADNDRGRGHHNSRDARGVWSYTRGMRPSDQRRRDTRSTFDDRRTPERRYPPEKSNNSSPRTKQRQDFRREVRRLEPVVGHREGRCEDVRRNDDRKRKRSPSPADEKFARPAATRSREPQGHSRTRTTSGTQGSETAVEDFPQRMEEANPQVWEDGYELDELDYPSPKPRSLFASEQSVSPASLNSQVAPLLVRPRSQ
ncbi:hypothetical protein FA15DRAFT_609251 [Coprinopsis marcescibilis]|uniref:JmjC domain-containing protein n=1 Tax=Coprinopsis marcescibilis TaxID=230819 RepID=A0A5C3LBU4_COPMA|nr:hypothetical protein FA15DRAFT_609251 [Coprinopsis marcescibilis]